MRVLLLARPIFSPPIGRFIRRASARSSPSVIAPSSLSMVSFSRASSPSSSLRGAAAVSRSFGSAAGSREPFPAFFPSAPFFSERRSLSGEGNIRSIMAASWSEGRAITEAESSAPSAAPRTAESEALTADTSPVISSDTRPPPSRRQLRSRTSAAFSAASSPSTAGRYPRNSISPSAFIV